MKIEVERIWFLRVSGRRKLWREGRRAGGNGHRQTHGFYSVLLNKTQNFSNDTV